MVTTRHAAAALCLTLICNELLPAQAPPGAQQTRPTRRSQRVRMPQIDVRSPNGHVTLRFLPNAERLTFTVQLGNVTVIEPSPIVLTLDGYDLSGHHRPRARRRRRFPRAIYGGTLEQIFDERISPEQTERDRDTANAKRHRSRKYRMAAQPRHRPAQ